ncbi:hypothetical protein ACR9HU_23715 (plasmid) [Enterobacter ludwigii]|jgi:hypothetical protein
MSDLPTVLRLFRINTIGQNVVFSDHLYANFKHQCPVEITVEKSVFNNGRWETVPLSSTERESITVTEFSNEINSPLPSGWAVDDSRNPHLDMGLWQGRSSFNMEDFSHQNIGTDTETIFRFLRSSLPAQPKRLMAVITLDNGEKITTNYNRNDMVFNSSVTISPRPPLSIFAENLINRNESLLIHNGSKYSVQVHGSFWSLPEGLRTTDVTYGNGWNSGIFLLSRRDFDITVHVVQPGIIRLTVNQLQPHTVSSWPELNGRTVHVQAADIRGVILYDNWQGNRNAWPVDRGTNITLIDNFGNSHAYTLLRNGNSIRELRLVNRNI